MNHRAARRNAALILVNPRRGRVNEPPIRNAHVRRRSAESCAVQMEQALCALGYDVWRDTALLPHDTYPKEIER